MIKSFVLVFFSLLLVGSANAERYTVVEGEGRFYSKDGDSITFIKKQLLYQAYRDVLTKQLTKMGLDHELFWNKYEEKFEEYFKPILDEQKQKYKITEEYKGNNPRYESVVRKKRLVLKSKFGRLNRAIRSYSEKKMTISTQMPNSRYINISAKISRSVLNKIYYNFISERKNRDFEKIFLDVNFKLIGANWSDLGVEVETDFTTVVKEHWRRWLQDNFKSQVSNIEVVEPSLQVSLKEYLKVPRLITHSLIADDSSSENDELFLQFDNSLLLTVNVIIEKKEKRDLFKEVTFYFDGDYLLLDMVERKVLAHHDFGKSKHTYSIENDHTLSSNIASYIYRIPLTELVTVPKKLARVPDRNGLITLDVTNIKNVNDLWTVNEFLISKGALYQFSTELDQYDGDSCRIKLSFRGNTDDVLKTLQSLEGVPVNEKIKISFDNPENPLAINLTEVVDEESKGKVEEDKEGLNAKNGI